MVTLCKHKLDERTVEVIYGQIDVKEVLTEAICGECGQVFAKDGEFFKRSKSGGVWMYENAVSDDKGKLRKKGGWFFHHLPQWSSL